MSTYICTFRTDHKIATLPDGRLVKVYAYRFLCKAQDAADHWGERKRRAALMQSSMDRAASLFAEHKPTHVADVYENDWEGVIVRAEPKGAVWYDCGDFPAGPLVGFLKRDGRGWKVALDRHQDTEGLMVAGRKVFRRTLCRIVEGKLLEHPLYYVVDGKQMVPTQFDAWRAEEEPKWIAECQRRSDEQYEREGIAMREREAKQAAKDAEIADLTRKLEELKRQRAAI